MTIGIAKLVRAFVAIVIVVAGLTVTAPRSASAQALPSIPEISGKAFYSFDMDANVELYAFNADEPLAPASTTKLMTALVFAQQFAGEDLSQQIVTIEAGDLADEGESIMGLEVGDTVSLLDLVYGLLLQSGNDAAKTLARVTGQKMLAAEGAEGDSRARFVQEMNATAGRLELTRTQFTNPSGIDQEGQYTTARELARIASKTFTHPLLKDVIKTSSYEVTFGGLNPRALTVTTTVKMKDDKGVLGGKTGTTPEAGACLALETQERGGNRIISVLLGSSIEFDANGAQVEGSDLRYDDMRAILEKMDTDYEWVDISRDEDVPGLKAEMAAWQVELESSDSIVVPRRDESPVTYLLALGPEGSTEAEVGRVLFFQNAEQVAERTVIQLAPGEQAA